MECLRVPRGLVIVDNPRAPIFRTRRMQLWRIALATIVATLLLHFCFVEISLSGLHGGRNAESELSTPQWPRDSEQHSYLVERGDYEKSAARGCMLVKLMNTPESELQPEYKTPWTDYEDIEKYGWSQDPAEAEVNADEEDHAKTILQSLGIQAGLMDPAWTKVAWKHDREVTVDGKTYPATNAYYTCIYNPSAGIIVAANNLSPSKVDPSPIFRTPLHRFSDIVFLTYAHLCSQINQPAPYGHNLKHVVRLSAVSSDLTSTLEHITQGDLGSTLKSFPGVEITDVPDGNDARALIGTSNGLGVAWMLIQHKIVLGDRRRVGGMRVWDSDEGQRSGFGGLDGIPNVLFTIDEQ